LKTPGNIWNLKITNRLGYKNEPTAKLQYVVTKPLQKDFYTRILTKPLGYYLWCSFPLTLEPTGTVGDVQFPNWALGGTIDTDTLTCWRFENGNPAIVWWESYVLYLYTTWKSVPSFVHLKDSTWFESVSIGSSLSSRRKTALYKLVHVFISPD
jgi:hypothetical protein